jgi:predicted RNA-binding protein with PUA-like domain
MGKEVKRFLLKTEPSEWSWEDQEANGGISKWDGVKNKQAQKYLKSMSLNDLCFFYHSGPKSRRIVGVVSVVKEWYTDDKDDGDGAVDVKVVGEMRRAVDLKEMKHMKDFVLLKQPRLSVVPVPHVIWDTICHLGDGYHGDGNHESNPVD